MTMKRHSLTTAARAIALAAALTAPGQAMAADLCEGLSPEFEIACLQLYLQDLDAEGYEINNALSGTWYNPLRDGEGFMIDVANHGEIVISFYTYDTSGNQVWLIGSGDVDGSVAVIEFHITDDGIYGAGFDPLLVNRYYWGTGTFSFSECSTGVAELIPTTAFAGQFETLVTDITRLTVPVNCTPRD